jgi:hypothetical protein
MADSEIADLSLCGVRIANLITVRIFATASLYAAPEWADRRALIGAVDVYAFLLIFYRLIVEKRTTNSERPA